MVQPTSAWVPDCMKRQGTPHLDYDMRENKILYSLSH